MKQIKKRGWCLVLIFVQAPQPLSFTKQKTLGHPLPEHQIQMTFRGRFDNPLRMSKPITKPIPVRIPNDALRRIEAAAKKLGSNRSRIAAFAIQKFTEYAENRGVVTLPPDWGAIFKSPGKLKQKPR
jgi:hypothetical protein